MRLRTALPLFFLLAGCGGGTNVPDLVPVTGTVTYKNAPLADVNVSFLPATGPAATGVTGTDGKYTLKTNGAIGAVPGKHKVTVSSAAVPPMPGTPEAKAAPDAAFPKKYNDPALSGLEATLPNDGQPIDIKLVD